MNYRFLCFLAGMFCAGSLSAQSPTPSPLPSGPLLKRAPENSTWKIIIRGQPAANEPTAAAAATDGADRQNKSEPPVISQSSVVKTGPTILEESLDAKGQRVEVWHVSGLRVTKRPDERPVVSPDYYGGGDIYSVNFAVSDFAGLEWISAKTYTGVVQYQGKDCLVFNDNISPLTARLREEEVIAINQAKVFGMEVPVERKVPAAAYIDLESRLPLLVTFGNEKRAYEYGSTPTTSLQLPPDVASQVKEYVMRIKRLSAPPSKSF